MSSKLRCAWCKDDPLYQTYHDEEWGFPTNDPAKLFEFIILEGMQAGLSWITVLRKRQAMREAFVNFDPIALANFNKNDIKRLMKNPNLIRHEAKLNALIANAKAFLTIEEKQGFANYIWDFVGGKPLNRRYKELKDIPTSTDISQQMSKSMKKAGFIFFGPTIAYAFMQAVGLVNDHVLDCYRHQEISQLNFKHR